MPVTHLPAAPAHWPLGRLTGFVRDQSILSRSHAAYLSIKAVHGLRQKVKSSSSQRRTTVESIFALPSGWDEGKRSQWAIDQYRKYVQAMDVIARQRNVHRAYFIQPVPAIGKTLTDRERSVAGDLGYREKYQGMTDSLLALRQEGIPIHSLLKVFADYLGGLYADPIHLERDSRGDSVGYRLMAAEMAKALATEWKLKPKT